MKPRHSRLPVLAAAIALVTACSPGPESPTATIEPTDAHLAHAWKKADATVGQLQAAARVRAATARFASLATAQAAGYTLQFPAGCASSADGAQGFHYMNPDLVDTKIDLLEPELLMYERQADGSMVLVGVDYAVPIEQWKGAQPPVLMGEKLNRLDALGVWAIHIWAHRENPNGLFAAWNPRVSCANAP